jgi:hypothetical protein
MKYFTFAKFLLIFTCLSSVCNANNKDLFDIITHKPSYDKVLLFLEDSSDLIKPDVRTNSTLKHVEEFGETFTGHAILNNSNIESISLWTSNERILPNDARVLFDHILKKVSADMGKGSIVENIPNHEDASDVQMDAYLWKDKEDIIVLMITEYPSRAGISLSRQTQSTWLENMGADSGEFWVKTLQSFNQNSSSDSSVSDNSMKRIPDSNDGNSLQNPVPRTPYNIEDKANAKSGDTEIVFPWLIASLIGLMIISISVIIIKKKR